MHALKDYSLQVCSTLAKARELIATEKYKMVIIDIELPDGSGHELMPLLNNEYNHTSVLFLTSHSGYHEKQAAFSLGAFDYIQKPFDPRELKLRIEAQMKRMTSYETEKNVIKIGDLTCNIDEQKIYSNSMPVKSMDLTGIEFKIFKLLTKTPETNFSRESILSKIWGDSVSITARTVDVHISNLRRKLSNTDVSIQHKHGHGYCVSTLARNEAMASSLA
jgi:DNA-binding response OmpR family regulator